MFNAVSQPLQLPRDGQATSSPTFCGVFAVVAPLPLVHDQPARYSSSDPSYFFLYKRQGGQVLLSTLTFSMLLQPFSPRDFLNVETHIKPLPPDFMSRHRQNLPHLKALVRVATEHGS